MKLILAMHVHQLIAAGPLSRTRICMKNSNVSHAGTNSLLEGSSFWCCCMYSDLKAISR